ncbi:hypothetical protein [Sediminibacillus terrae]|uniref:hypothetical protein n=1 Tax=Sediminibacillus terrae TaxID=1562106 RepID=UPI0012965A6A|nr:hypothetical protein [Sediminibacillus terrae]
MGKYVLKKNKRSLHLNSWFGYVLIAASIAGYFGYYLPNDDAFIWQWVILSLAGVLFLSYKNIKLKKNKLRTVILDILYMIVLTLIASIPWPRGLSILLMIFVAGLLVPLLMHLAFQPWSKK